ncbi:MAG: MFS transporter [Anaerolineae bacterium]|jgi:DHA1 family tetracycline resistance protein-like MFS transporter
MQKRRLSLIVGFVFIELLGYSLFLPLLPYYAGSLGAGPAAIGLLIASNAVAQFLAAPFIGRVSDTRGRRPTLLFSIAGTIVGFALLGLIEPLGRGLAALAPGWFSPKSAALALLYFSRILDGLAGGNVSLARAYITDITDEKNRARGLGLIGAAFGTGFIIGPALGGTMSNWPLVTGAFEAAGLSRYSVPALAALLLAVLNLVGVALWLPESLTPERRAALTGRKRSILPIPALGEALKQPRVAPLLQIRFLYLLAFAMFTTNFALYTQYRFGLTDKMTGFILTYVGVLVVLVQGVVVGWLADRYPEKKIIVAAVAVLALGLLGWAVVPNVPLMLAVLLFLPLSGGTLNTVTNSALTKAVRQEDIGGTLGLSAALDSVTRIVAPIAGGFLIGQVGPWAVGAVGALIMGWVVFYAWRCLVANATVCWDEPSEDQVAPEAVA